MSEENKFIALWFIGAASSVQHNMLCRHIGILEYFQISFYHHTGLSDLRFVKPSPYRLIGSGQILLQYYLCRHISLIRDRRHPGLSIIVTLFLLIG